MRTANILFHITTKMMRPSAIEWYVCCAVIQWSYLINACCVLLASSAATNKLHLFSLESVVEMSVRNRHKNDWAVLEMTRIKKINNLINWIGIGCVKRYRVERAAKRANKRESIWITALDRNICINTQPRTDYIWRERTEHGSIHGFRIIFNYRFSSNAGRIIAAIVLVFLSPSACTITQNTDARII